MYRVAVVQNEREMLRAGYVNFAPRLKESPHLGQYAFTIFDATNIAELFGDGINSIRHFDGLFIATNATSDSLVLASLQENKSRVEDFLQRGGGLFVGSQKKLSASVVGVRDRLLDEEDSRTGTTGFLPDLYEFGTVERPEAEYDSGEGVISEYVDRDDNGKRSLLLRYPTRVTAKGTQARCESNEFKRHVYRSVLRPLSAGAYSSVFVDTSYSGPEARILLMINSVSESGEKLVITTIVIDWEYHEDLLVNIIRYITEGIPNVAFISKERVPYGDYDYIISSVMLSKLAHALYNSPNQIPNELLEIHNTFIFSPGWDEQEITTFWWKITSSTRSGKRWSRNHRRVYYFREAADNLGLTQISNFSSVDLIIDNAILWLDSQFADGMWFGSFWTSYDVLAMMLELNVDVESYIQPVMNDIREHYYDGSYDGVMGATCGLLELLISLSPNYVSELRQSSMAEQAIASTLTWVVENFPVQSLYDAQTAVLTLSKLSLDSLGAPFRAQYKKMLSEVQARRNELQIYTELDVCRKIAVSALFSDRDKEAPALLTKLKELQSPEGMWVSTKRTAFVVAFLLKEVVSWVSKNARSDVDQMIYAGVVHLRSKYDEVRGNWEQDAQTTAKALHAIGLYNRIYGYSTQDFFESIRFESRQLRTSATIQGAIKSLNRMRLGVNAEDRKVQEIVAEAETAAINYVTRSRYVAAICASLLVGIILSLAIYHPSVLLDLVKGVGSVLALVLSAIVGVVIGVLMQRPTSIRGKRRDS